MPMSEDRHNVEEDQRLIEVRPIGKAGMGGVALASAGVSVLCLVFGQGDIRKQHEVGVLVGSFILIAAGWLALWRDRRGSRLDRGSLGRIIASALVPCVLISATWIAMVVSQRGGSRSRRSRERVKSSAETVGNPDARAEPSGTKPGWKTYSQLLEQRIVVLKGAITEDAATVTIASLRYLDRDAPGQEIRLYIDSAGGGVAEGMAIHDTMRSLESPVSTVCIGQAMATSIPKWTCVAVQMG
jgi:hypothetical protein